MPLDAPARIAIIGAGPIGLEVALYARFLGYQVDLYERGTVAENIRAWGHLRLFSPFGMNRSPLALGALQAQDAGCDPPADDELLTGAEYARRYLIPLSQTDLIADSLREGVAVLGIGKASWLKGQMIGKPERAEDEFVLLTRGPDGKEQREFADAVIDASGAFGNPNSLGQGGLPASGERDAADLIDYGLPDPLGSDRAKFAGKTILVIGGGYSAASSVVALAELAREEASTKIIWATLCETEEPISRIQGDRLPERDRLAEAANRLAREDSPVVHLPGAAVVSLERGPDGDLIAHWADADREPSRVDRIIANVGYRPDLDMHRELQVHQCYATEGPMKLAAALLGASGGDCLDQTSHGSKTLLNPEPNFYVLGAKSYGRNSQFLISVGLRQIQELFTIIGGRESLDLYAAQGKPSS